MADGTPNSGKTGPVRPHHRLQFGWKRRLPMMLQTEAGECGLACLAMLASYYGHDVDVSGLRRRFSTSLKGTTLTQIISIASQLQLECRPLKLQLEEISQLRTPCLLHWDLDHFVVLKRADRRGIVIHDPGRGVYKLTLKRASDHFTGVAMEITPAAEFAPLQERRAVSLRSLTGNIQGLLPALVQILAMALALEVLGLTAPFYMQWILDQVLVSADHDLLTLLGMGFLAITVFSALITAVRSWAVTWLSTTLKVQWSSNLFSHMMRLPLDWFEKRHVGDVVSRFASIQAIQQTLTTQFVGSILDGLMSIITIIVMSIYSVRLTAIIFGIFIAYAAIRWLFFRPFRRASEGQLVCGARLQSELLESIRGSMTIKLGGKQGERLSRYANAVVETANKNIEIQRLSISFAFINQLLFGVGKIALIWTAAILALKHHFSAGMLIAFIAYADQFTGRAASLVDKWVSFRMLKLHGERVADIALNPPEENGRGLGLGESPKSTLEFRNVSFRYAEGEPWVVSNCSFFVECGESVAIVGPSGSGKSTIAKIALGLLDPSEGRVLFNGMDIRRIGLCNYRECVAAVMQDDQLFAGSISENISFFDPSVTEEAVAEAARLAAIDDDISAFPMGYKSLVGDMGSSLSGGQRQRVILARALYKKPLLLVLDEATSHLDVVREAVVNQSIEKMSITRLVISHRPETISGMRVIDISGKKVRAEGVIFG